MGVDRAIAVLTGAGDETSATALTWLDERVVAALAWGSQLEGPAAQLAGVAEAFGVDLAFVPARVPWAAAAVAELHARGIAAAWAVDGPFGRVCEALGWSRAIALTAQEPGALAAPLASALHDASDQARAGIGSGADVLVIADDLAGRDGWLVNPDFALSALAACYHHLINVRPDRVPAVFHSDGDVRALMPELARSGFSGVHLGAAGPGGLAHEISGALGAGLVPLGGIVTSDLIAQGARASAEAARELALLGPLVIADDGGISRPEEAAALGAALGQLA